MVVAWPLALTLLIPWGAVLYWTLRGFSESANVPFLPFWEPTASESTRRRALRAPPLWIALLLAAALLSIFAAAGLSIRSRQASVTLIVDCRLGMSGRRVDDAIAPMQLNARDRCHLIPVPGEPYDTHGNTVSRGLDFTANPDAGPLTQAIHDRLSETSGPVYVVSDRAIPLDDPRVMRLTSPHALVNAGIDRFAITDGPHPQAMVRIFNGTAGSSAYLWVDQTAQHIQLPPRGGTQDYFIDLPKVYDRSIARLSIADDVTADNTAYLTRGQVWPTLDVRSPVSEPLQRMIDVYTKHRPTIVDAPKIVVASTEPHAAMLGVILPIGPIQSPPTDAPLSVDATHPITQNVDWRSAADRIRDVTPPGGKWHAIVRIGSHDVVAIREVPRAVWVAIADADWSIRPDYVIFWTNVFDWLGRGDPTLSATPVPASMDHPTGIVQADPSIIDSPGLYRDSAGRLVATSIPAVRSDNEGLQANPEFRRENIETQISLARYNLVAAAVLCALSLAWCRA